MTEKEYLIGYKIDQVFELTLRLKEEKLEYYRRIKAKELSRKAIEILEALDFATTEVNTHYTPHITGEWDHKPTNQEFSDAIEQGHVGISYDAQGDFRRALELFLSRKIGFAEFKAAAKRAA